MNSNNDEYLISMIMSPEKSLCQLTTKLDSTPRKTRTSSSWKAITFDIAIILIFASGFAQWYSSSFASTLDVALDGATSQQHDLSQEEIELLWEKQHVQELEQKYQGAEVHYDEVLKQNVALEKQLTDLKNKLAEQENVKLKEQLARALESRESRIPQGTQATPSSSSAPQIVHLRGDANSSNLKYRTGEIVELYDPSKPSSQEWLAPSKIEKRYSSHSSSGLYDAVRATDGFQLTGVPEMAIHRYEPYAIGTPALCNVGEYGRGKMRFQHCEVLGYMPKAKHGIMVLQGEYRVRIFGTEGGEDYEVKLPVWKLQRQRV